MDVVSCLDWDNGLPAARSSTFEEIVPLSEDSLLQEPPPVKKPEFAEPFSQSSASALSSHGSFSKYGNTAVKILYWSGTENQSPWVLEIMQGKKNSGIHIECHWNLSSPVIITSKVFGNCGSGKNMLIIPPPGRGMMSSVEFLSRRLRYMMPRDLVIRSWRAGSFIKWS